MVSSSSSGRSPRRAAAFAIVAIWCSATVATTNAIASSTSAGDGQNLRRQVFKKRRLKNTEAQAMLTKIKSLAKEEAAEKRSTKDGHHRRRLGASYCTQSTLSGNSDYTYSASASGGDFGGGTATLYASYDTSYYPTPASGDPDPFCFEFSLTDSSKFLLGRCSFLLASCFLMASLAIFSCRR